MTPNTNNITRTEANKELYDFAASIDFTELFDNIQTFLNIRDYLFMFNEPELYENKNGELFISFTSPDITQNHVGAFAAILKSCCISNFSNGVCRDRETDEPKYWVSVSLRYEHIDGGRNGMDICMAHYTDREGWVIRNAGTR